MRIAASAIVVVVVLGARPARAGERVVRYRDDKLSVRLEKVALPELLAALEEVTGADIRGEPVDPAEVSGEFTDLPLPEALGRLLGEHSFALTYAKDGSPRLIDLLDRSLGATGVQRVALTPPPVSPLILAGLFHRHPPVPVSGELAQVLGSGTATLIQLAATAVRQDDGAIRAAATVRLLQVVESEPELRTAVGSMDDAALGQALHGLPIDRAEELLNSVAAQAGSPELRARAAALLQQRQTQAGSTRPAGG